jgi:hypothetical protein
MSKPEPLLFAWPTPCPEIRATDAPVDGEAKIADWEQRAGRNIATMLRQEGYLAVDLQPQSGTSFVLHMTYVPREAVLLIVSENWQRGAVFDIGPPVLHWSYLQEKLGIPAETRPHYEGVRVARLLHHVRRGLANAVDVTPKTVCAEATI